MSSVVRERYQSAHKDLLARLSEYELEDLALFFKKHDIMVKTRAQSTDQTLVKIKYMDSCRFGKPFTVACRGSTFWLQERKVTQAVFALNKFFNFHEMERGAPHFQVPQGQTLDQWFCAQGMELVMMVKHDGSNMQLFYDDQGTLHAYTLGALQPFPMSRDPSEKQGSSPTFAQAAETALKALPKLDAFLKKHPFVSLVAELISKWNPIITKYTFHDKGPACYLVPLVMIDKAGLPRWDMLYEAEPSVFTIPDKKDGKDMCNYLPMHAERIPPDSKLMEALRARGKVLLRDPQTFGENPEGIVVYAVTPDRTLAIPFAKYKLQEYLDILAQKQAGTDDAAHPKTVLRLQEQECAGTLDLGEIAKEEHKVVIQEMRKIMDILAQDVSSLLQAHPSRKDYAIALNKNSRFTHLKGELLSNYEPLRQAHADTSLTRDTLYKIVLPSLERLHKRYGDKWYNG